jgi:hypothetical protein
MWVLLVLVLSVAQTTGPAIGVAGSPATGTVGTPAMQEFQSEGACRRAGEAMDNLLGFVGWSADRRFIRVQWTCVPK